MRQRAELLRTRSNRCYLLVCSRSGDAGDEQLGAGAARTRLHRVDRLEREVELTPPLRGLGQQTPGLLARI